MTLTTFTQDQITSLGARAETMVNSLGTVSAEPDRLVRLFLTPEHRRAAMLRREKQAHQPVRLGRNRAERIDHRLGARAERRDLILREGRQGHAALEHDPEKWTPVFGKDHAPPREIQRIPLITPLRKW